MHSIVCVTRRPGGYDVLVEAVGRQTNGNYQVMCDAVSIYTHTHTHTHTHARTHAHTHTHTSVVGRGDEAELGAVWYAYDMSAYI